MLLVLETFQEFLQEVCPRLPEGPRFVSESLDADTR